MNSARSVKYKALFLLVSFSLNTVVGFACSLGIGLGFNSGHHEDHDEEQPNHSDEENSGAAQNDHHNKHSLNHAQVGYIENSSVTTGSEDENCCKGFVVGFQSLDKQLAQKANFAKIKIAVTPFILHAILPFKNTIYFEPVRTPPKIPYHSPPDIRVFIQSFLI